MEKRICRGAVRWAFNCSEWNPSEEQWLQALDLVSEEERQRIMRFKRPTPSMGLLVGRTNPDAKSALAGRLMMLLLAATELDIEVNRVRFDRTPERKPYLAIPCCHIFPHFNFNLSHEGDWVVLASEPIDLVGIDVMKVGLRGGDKDVGKFLHNMQNCFTKHEWTTIRGIPCDDDKKKRITDTETLRRFFYYWTLKEAYIKAVGVGLELDLQRLEFHIDNLDDEDDDQSSKRPPSMLKKALVKIDAEWRREWSFEVGLPFELNHQHGEEHVVAIARGPYEQAAASYQACLHRVNDNMSVSSGHKDAPTLQHQCPWRVWRYDELIQAIFTRMAKEGN